MPIKPISIFHASREHASLLVDLKTAAKILGIAPSSVRALVRRRSLPRVRAGRGGKIFIPRIALTNFVAALARRTERRNRANA
ncbi:MAG: helix-turn-helix domain-containing protein [Candidatus Acidiferrales bacterium]